MSNILSYTNRDAKMNSRKCDICNVDIHRASYIKHLRSKKHLENMKKNEMIILNRYFKNLLKIKATKYLIRNH